MCGVTFTKYFEWEDGIQCQKSNLTKFSPVRFLKFGQIQLLTLDSVSPVKLLGKIPPRFKTFKLAQKSSRNGGGEGGGFDLLTITQYLTSCYSRESRLFTYSKS